MRLRRVLVPLGLSPANVMPETSAAVHVLAGRTMGTTWSVKLVAPAGTCMANWRHGIEARLALVNAQMSHWDPDSDLSRFNRAAPGAWQILPEDFFTVLDEALAVAHDSAGAFDPAAGRLVDLWGFGPSGFGTPSDGGGRVPSHPAIAEALRDGGWDRIELDRAQSRARRSACVRLDLSAVAKGYAVDLVAEYLLRCGLRHVLVEIGGELRGHGVRPDGQPWWVALEQPPSAAPAGAAGSCQAVVALHGLAVATTGDYRRCFEHGGRRHGHTIDPRSGRPVAHALASVTVLHRTCMLADALSTAITVLGPDQGLAFAKARGIAALLVCRAGSGFDEHLSPALSAMLG